ncbi:hypothetical protein [Maritimibacter sp. DP1N21-5]|uniref:hypothetical protein n=1 Tax=Maritimibacter sp. DP1N21-5 TaxID=2836867 RepID=UPI001C485657|nr:hypothetical protein [Maritimibacter sp. DP1N21-5]MBV7408766.1 hypothetical protein [Maritimibacter sp. DP1N21-5]
MAATMVNIADLLPSVLIHVPTCARPVAIHHIRLAAAEFLSGTTIWRETFTQTIEAATFVLDVPENTRAVQVHRVTYAGFDLEKARAAHIPAGEVPASPPSHFYQAEVGKLSVYPFTECDLDITVSLTVPKAGAWAQELPDAVISDYGDVIADGAAGKLMLLPGTDYANPAMAAHLIAQFEAKIGELSARGATGIARAPLRVKPSWL